MYVSRMKTISVNQFSSCRCWVWKSACVMPESLPRSALPFLLPYRRQKFAYSVFGLVIWKSSSVMLVSVLSIALPSVGTGGASTCRNQKQIHKRF